MTRSFLGSESEAQGTKHNKFCFLFPAPVLPMRVAEKISTSWFITQELPHQRLRWCQFSDDQQNLIFLEEMNVSAAKADLFAAGESLLWGPWGQAAPQHPILSPRFGVEGPLGPAFARDGGQLSAGVRQAVIWFPRNLSSWYPGVSCFSQHPPICRGKSQLRGLGVCLSWSGLRGRSILGAAPPAWPPGPG